MLKKLLLTSAIAATLATPVLASASTAPAQNSGQGYIGASLGATYLPNMYLRLYLDNENTSYDYKLGDTAFTFSGFGGYRFANHLDLQLESSLSAFPIQGSDAGFAISLVTINLLYHFENTSTKWAPYIGAGFGAARYGYVEDSEFHFNGDDDSDHASQAIAGIEYRVNRNVAIAADYRATWVDKIDNTLNRFAVTVSYLF